MIRLTHKKIVLYVFAVFIIIVLLYAYFEARHILYGPQVVLAHSDGAVTTNTQRVEITGSAKNVVEISLDGRPITVSDTGVFREVLLLTKGVNRFSFSARDRFGRTTHEQLEVVYIPKIEPEQDMSEPAMIQEQLETTSN